MVKLMLSDIKGYDKNNKDHPRQQIDLLKKMITEYGYDSPIIVNKDGIVIAGHGRLLALKELAEEGNKDYLEVEVIKKDKLTKKQEQKYRLLDNKISELATSNPDNIKLELEELEDLELNELYPEIDLKEIELDEANEDTVPEPQKEAKLVKVGDIFQLGNHRIMCGDSTVKEDVDKLMDGKKADMVFTDPPYGANMGIMNDGDEFLQVFEGFIQNINCDDNIYICCDWRCVGQFISSIQLNGYELYNMIVWVKNLFGQGKLYHTKHEEILFLGKGKFMNENMNKDENVWNSDSVRNFGGSKNSNEAVGHPTQKPTDIVCRAINMSSKQNQIVGDLFLGSGSTLIACEKTNRICYGMELDPVYIEVILKRYHDYTKGQKPIKCISRTLDLNPILNG